MRGGSRGLRALVVGVLAAAAAWGVAASGWLDAAERGLVDRRFEVRGSHGAPPDVVVVAIDERSLSSGPRWPFPRSRHATVIRRLLAAGARAVLYDVQFSDETTSREDDALLRAAADPRVVLASVIVGDRNGRSRFAVIGERQLRRGGAQIGAAIFPAEDGGFRDLETAVGGLSHADVLAAGVPPRDPSQGTEIAAPPRPRTRPIDFAGPPGTVRQLSFAKVLAGTFDASAVRNRIAVVGATALELNDLHRTPVGGLMSGPEVHANAIQTVLDGDPLREAGWPVAVLFVLAAALLAPLATLRGPPGRSVLQALAATVLGALVLLAGAQLAFDGGTILPLAPALLALLLGSVGAIGLTYAVEVLERRHVRAAFERFVPPGVVDEILRRDDGSARLEGRRLDATVMFCDLRGFTALAEGLPAERVIEVLNRYLELVSGAVFDHGGTVVSYQGDGVMAVFGAPLAQPDHAARAFAAARQVLDRALPGFNAWLQAERLTAEPLAAGIGLNSGPVMSGSVGSARRLEYAAVGDTTNVAARLQALSRSAEASLFVSASTRAALDPAATELLRPHGEIELRGRREPVAVYTL